MAQVVAGYPDRFTGFPYRDPFASEAAEEPQRVVVDPEARGTRCWHRCCPGALLMDAVSCHRQELIHA